MFKFPHIHKSVKLKCKSIGYGDGAFIAQMDGAVMAKWVTVFWVIYSKNTGLLGSTLSGHCMTTGFGPFELLTHCLLRKGRDHSPPKACFEWRAQLSVAIHRAMNILITKQIVGGLNGWSYHNIMGQRTDFCRVADSLSSRLGGTLEKLAVWRLVLLYWKILSLNIRVCAVATFSWWV